MNECRHYYNGESFDDEMIETCQLCGKPKKEVDEFII